MAPGTPGTDTSAKVVTQTTVTETQPPATKFDVSTVICGAVHVSPAPVEGRLRRGRGLALGVGGIGLDDRGLDAGAAADSTSPWAESTAAEGDHEDDHDQKDRGDDHQLGDGRTFLRPHAGPPLAALSHCAGTPGRGRRWWPTR